MPKPLIGLTTTRTSRSSRTPKYGANVLYATAISGAGGLPVLIPANLPTDDLDALLNRLNGVLFTGGYDIDPRHYGNHPHPKVEGVDRERDLIEIELVHKLALSGKPFMGICRGLQLINVALGGSLYEHLPEQFPGNVIHDNHDLPRDYLAHSIRVTPDGRLSNIIPHEQVKVNSLHHQGIRQLAPDLLATAYAPDGLIEAFDFPGRSFGLAVQWHPEELHAQEDMRALFQAFIKYCIDLNLK